MAITPQQIASTLFHESELVCSEMTDEQKKSAMGLISRMVNSTVTHLVINRESVKDFKDLFAICDQWEALATEKGYPNEMIPF